MVALHSPECRLAAVLHLDAGTALLHQRLHLRLFAVQREPLDGVVVLELAGRIHKVGLLQEAAQETLRVGVHLREVTVAQQHQMLLVEALVLLQTAEREPFRLLHLVVCEWL